MTDNSNYEIMIIDDISENLNFLNTLLINHNYKTRPFKSGKVSLRSARLKPPHLVLVDINMPEMNGYEFCREFKKFEELQEIPIIFISALHEESSKVTAFESGGVDYVTKPFQLAEVIARVETHLKISKYRNEINEKNIQLKNNIIELRKTQAQLVHTEKMASLGVMASGVAHEINNPINSINGNSLVFKSVIDDFKNIWDSLKECSEIELNEALLKFDIIRNDYGYEEIINDAGSIIDNIITASNRAAKITADLLQFVRMDSVEILLTDIHECIESTIAISSNKIPSSIKIVRKFGKLPMVSTNPSKLNQVILNLLLNAIDSYEEIIEKEIKDIIIETSIKSTDEKSRISITVTDKGTGIENKNLKNIFDPFFSTKEVGKGTGLGLSICKGLIESLNGELLVRSNLGVGSTFEILIPV